jgi:broad-specificity NMP kinase
LAKTEQQIADLGVQMLSVFNLIKSDDGSRKDDQAMATQIIDMRAVLNSLNTLSAQLNNIITN